MPNGVNVEGATHKQVVDLIKSGGDKLRLTVISVTAAEAERLEPHEDCGGISYVDYSEKRSLPISIPDYSWSEPQRGSSATTEKYAVYNIYMAGRHLCSRRYREFANLHASLKREFPDFAFPKLPGKWPFALSDQQLDSRRRGLEQYLEKVCAVRVIAEHDIVQDFLTDDDENGASACIVDVKVLLPDRITVVVSVRKNSQSTEVYDAVMAKSGVSIDVAKYFALFEIVEFGFERKLLSSEFPYNLYIQNYSTATATCLVVRKWLFSLKLEVRLAESLDTARSWLFWQAVDDVNKGQIKPGNQLYQLKALQDSPSRQDEYLALARTLEGYGEVSFPHCACDARKEGHVVASVGKTNFKLQACAEDGLLQNQVIEFEWENITSWEADAEGMAFQFEYGRPDKKPRLIKIYTPYFVFMLDCFERVSEERKWAANKPLAASKACLDKCLARGSLPNVTRTASMTNNTTWRSTPPLNSSQSSDEFASSLFNLLPSAAQKDVDEFAQIEQRMKSHEPLLISQDNKVTALLIDIQLLRTGQLKEELELIENEVKEIQHDLLLLKDVDIQKLEENLTKLASQIELHQMKINDYGNETMPLAPSLNLLKVKNSDRETLREQVVQLRLKGKMYEGIDNFHVDSIRRMVQKVEHELKCITERIATHVTSRKSLGV
ncbi:sorting nexin-27-like isoform X3 [Varroa jacobsoni]|uniref:sorting nexin-27-like isoform X3 n=1 Tax=Varroa jacobsoni TaxID=62625 RepID=UPI000BF8DA78|nr:sorting nexin-27-like isoform X3 [Varroa jacobsoni]